MATMNISLPNPMRDWVKNQTQNGQYANSSDYVRDLIRKDQQRAEKLESLQQAITQGLQSGDPKGFNMDQFKERMLKSWIMATYELYPAAEEDLEGIWKYSVVRWGTHQTLSYLDDLNQAFLLIAESPLITRERTEFDPPVRIYPHARHLIVYIVEDQQVKIVRVLHENMSVPLQLEK